jgi:hypothetical protein
VDTPSLSDNAAEFAKLNNELFGDGTGVHQLGKGKVYAGSTAADALKALNVETDFDAGSAAQTVKFVHRKTADAEIYFLDSRAVTETAFGASFRVTGKTPELWYSETGKTAPVSYSIAGGRTTVPLKLEPWGSVFVVFRKAAKEQTRTLPAVKETTLTTVDGAWDVAFQTGRGAPASVKFDKLISWPESADTGVKYFSGIGTYTKTITAPAEWLKGGQVWIDLGDVKNIAQVSVNGKELGTVWHKPFRVEATGALKAGQNQITVKVINAWVNRLIGDEQPGVTEKITFADFKAYKADSPLLPSGLIGPVTIVNRSEK